MTVTVKMPEYAYETADPPVIREIKCKKGDGVNPGDVLFTYSFDGALFEESAAFSGKVVAVFYEKGKETPPGTAVLAISDENEI